MQITGNTGNIAYQHPHDAGADLKSCEDTIIPANGRTLVHTGVYAGNPLQSRGPRVSTKRPRAEPRIDRAERARNHRQQLSRRTCVILCNTSERAVEITAGQRIAQLVVTPVAHVKIIPVSQLPEDTERGDKGFGSTGK